MKSRISTTRRRANRFAPAEEPFPSEAQAAFQKLVTDFAFPCIGAKAALNSGGASFGFYERLACDTSTKDLARDLERFTRAAVVPSGDQFATLIAVFRGPFELSELAFEKLLWQQLRKLHQVDAPNFPWDARASSDPNAPDFAFSFAGRAYYVIGMHANASRRARQFPWPTLIFNPHDQFERLRVEGKWERMKQTIRTRDFALQGSVNPMLSDFGEQSEARQYSGRAVEGDWRAPFVAAGKCPFSH